jgi:hypothetical protein
MFAPSMEACRKSLKKPVILDKSIPELFVKIFFSIFSLLFV